MQNKMCVCVCVCVYIYIHTIEYHSVIKKERNSDICYDVDETWINIENKLSESSQSSVDCTA